MQDDIRQCSFRNTVIYHVLIFKRALRAHVYSTKPFGKVLILWRDATNKCMYVKHIPQHNNLSLTSLLITLTVFNGATNSPIYKHRPCSIELGNIRPLSNQQIIFFFFQDAQNRIEALRCCKCEHANDECQREEFSLQLTHLTEPLWVVVLGVVPPFLMEKVPVMLGCDSGVFSPSSSSLEESSTNSDLKKSNRRSLGGKHHVYSHNTSLGNHITWLVWRKFNN